VNIRASKRAERKNIERRNKIAFNVENRRIKKIEAMMKLVFKITQAQKMNFKFLLNNKSQLDVSKKVTARDMLTKELMWKIAFLELKKHQILIFLHLRGLCQKERERTKHEFLSF
jgi:hypothetical protein